MSARLISRASLELSVSGKQLSTPGSPEPPPHEIRIVPPRPAALPSIAATAPSRSRRKGRLFEVRDSPLIRSNSAPVLPGVTSASGRAESRPDPRTASEVRPDAQPVRAELPGVVPNGATVSASVPFNAGDRSDGVPKCSANELLPMPAARAADGLRAVSTRIDSLEFDVTMRAEELRASVERSLAAARQLPSMLEAKDSTFSAEIADIDERLKRLEKARSLP